MQAFLFLVVAVFAATVNLSPTDLFESNSDWLNNDMSNANAQPIFGVDDQTQMPTDDIWHDDGSNLLAYGPENSNNQLQDLVPLPSSDGWLDSVLLPPSDSSTSLIPDELPTGDGSIVAGEICSANDPTSIPLKRRDFNLDFFWNLFKENPPKEAPNVCPAPGSTQQTSSEPKTDTQSGGNTPVDPPDECEAGYAPFCCRGEPLPDTATLEQCWHYSPRRKPICQFREHIWCCADFDDDSGEANGCYQLYPNAAAHAP